MMDVIVSAPCVGDLDTAISSRIGELAGVMQYGLHLKPHWEPKGTMPLEFTSATDLNRASSTDSVSAPTTAPFDGNMLYRDSWWRMVWYAPRSTCHSVRRNRSATEPLRRAQVFRAWCVLGDSRTGTDVIRSLTTSRVSCW